jgi:hypothetical protein
VLDIDCKVVNEFMHCKETSFKNPHLPFSKHCLNLNMGCINEPRIVDCSLSTPTKVQSSCMLTLPLFAPCLIGSFADSNLSLTVASDSCCCLSQMRRCSTGACVSEAVVFSQVMVTSQRFLSCKLRCNLV